MRECLKCFSCSGSTSVTGVLWAASAAVLDIDAALLKRGNPARLICFCPFGFVCLLCVKN